MDTCEPIFEETFEYLLSKSEVYDQFLVIKVKTKKFFNNNVIGEVIDVLINALLDWML